jgi:hypothetical protein
MPQCPCDFSAALKAHLAGEINHAMSALVDGAYRIFRRSAAALEKPNQRTLK